MRVYLETGADGLCMAHVLDLVGCTVRAPSREEALRRLPEAVRDYCNWLRRHGEPVPPQSDSPTLEVAGESVGFGPFNPGDAAALFPPDSQPLTRGELETYLRLMAHSRADLLELVRGLDDETLDWQPDAETFSIRRTLRHIGNAEQWYVSRLYAPEALPPEWERDEAMPVLDFLEMERRTAVALLRSLTEEQMSGVYHPSHWTKHPTEPWTARKVLRRFLEHEREHTSQIRETLNACEKHVSRPHPGRAPPPAPPESPSPAGRGSPRRDTISCASLTWDRALFAR